MPLARTGALDAYAINTEIGASSLNPGKSATAALSLNASDARSLAQLPSGAISYSSFRGKFEIYVGQDGYYALYGVSTDLGWGNFSSTGVSGYNIMRLEYNNGPAFPSGTQNRTELFISSGSSLGQSFFSTIKVGSTTLNSSSASAYGWSSNLGGFSYWYWTGDSFNFFGSVGTYKICTIT